MTSTTASRDFDEGFELFCRECGDVLARYYMEGKRAGKETAHICRCELRRHAETTMPDAVRAASVRPEHAASPLLDHFGKSAIVKSDWLDVLSVVKYWWYRSNSYGNTHVLLTSDQRIIEVGSGTDSKKQRSDDFRGPIYNTIEDFILPPGILAVHVGRIKTGTRDGVYYQGKFYEALYTRFCSMKPTWLVVAPGTSFSKAHYPHVWSEESESIVGKFPTVDASPERRRPSPEPTDVAEEEGPPGRRRGPEERKKVRPMPDGDADQGALSMYGSGVSKSRSLRGRE